MEGQRQCAITLPSLPVVDCQKHADSVTIGIVALWKCSLLKILKKSASLQITGKRRFKVEFGDQSTIVFLTVHCLVTDNYHCELFASTNRAFLVNTKFRFFNSTDTFWLYSATSPSKANTHTKPSNLWTLLAMAAVEVLTSKRAST